MNEFVSVSRNETVEILEPTERCLHGLYGLHGLRGPHSLQSAVCVLHNISCELAHSINAFS